LIPSAIDEILRYESPTAIAAIRFTTKQVIIGSVSIPADQVLLISPAAANHDPARYENPGGLNLHRDAASHMAFGHDIHYCLGARLARAETDRLRRRNRAGLQSERSDARSTQPSR
jgi:cytochrome P450